MHPSETGHIDTDVWMCCAKPSHAPGGVNWEIHAKELMMFMMLMAQALNSHRSKTNFLDLQNALHRGPRLWFWAGAGSRADLQDGSDNVGGLLWTCSNTRPLTFLLSWFIAHVCLVGVVNTCPLCKFCS